MNENSLKLVDAMDPISLSEMDGVSLMDRTDTKYVLNESDLQQVLANIAHDYRVLDVSGTRLAPYSTLYFDSPEHGCFLQHHNGKLNRYKFRVREYTSSRLCFFEIKKKNNKGRTQKQRLRLVASEQTLSASSLEFAESVIGFRPQLIPQLWTNFSRVTLVHRVLPERVTIDSNLSFEFDGLRRELPGVVIAEVKQQRDSRHSTIRAKFRQRHISNLRVSKYCLGTILLKPHLKSNRFKAKLRAIRKIA